MNEEAFYRRMAEGGTSEELEKWLQSQPNAILARMNDDPRDVLGSRAKEIHQQRKANYEKLIHARKGAKVSSAPKSFVPRKLPQRSFPVVPARRGEKGDPNNAPVRPDEPTSKSPLSLRLRKHLDFIFNCLENDVEVFKIKIETLQLDVKRTIEFKETEVSRIRDKYLFKVGDKVVLCIHPTRDEIHVKGLVDGELIELFHFEGEELVIHGSFQNLFLSVIECDLLEQVRRVLNQMGMDYNKLSEEEIEALMSELEKGGGGEAS